VGTPKASLRKFEAHLVAQDWEQVEAGVEVKLVRSPDGQETFILARSEERRQKEKAIHERFLERMETGLKKLQVAMESGRLRDEGQAQRRLGRLQGENSRAAKAFEVKLERLPAGDLPDSPPEAAEIASNQEPPPRQKPKKRRNNQPTLQITWQRNQAWSEWARLSEGCYLLRSNLNETDPKMLWKHYIQLTDAEWAFRITKDELVLRPIWHQKKDRVKAHILVCFLAYVIWKTLANWMRRSGLGDAPRSVLNELSKIKSSDVVLPVITDPQQPAQQVRLRCVTEPDPDQQLFLHRLGISLPKRLGSRLLPDPL
jgi:hypothetical protein